MLDITKIGFPSILRDNDMAYIAGILQIISGIDEHARVIIIKTLDSYSFNITPNKESDLKYLIRAISKYHKTIDLPIEYSKSIKLSRSLSFVLSK